MAIDGVGGPGQARRTGAASGPDEADAANPIAQLLQQMQNGGLSPEDQDKATQAAGPAVAAGAAPGGAGLGGLMKILDPIGLLGGGGGGGLLSGLLGGGGGGGNPIAGLLGGGGGGAGGGLGGLLG